MAEIHPAVKDKVIFLWKVCTKREIHEILTLRLVEVLVVEVAVEEIRDPTVLLLAAHRTFRVTQQHRTQRARSQLEGKHLCR